MHHIARSCNNPAGRPQSAKVTEALHKALWRLFDGKLGPPTMERIAEAAGVSRAALYRRYATVGEVTLGALLSFGTSGLPMRESADLEEDLRRYLSSVVESLHAGKPISRALRYVLSVSLVDPTFTPKFAEFLRQRRTPVLARLLKACPDVADQELQMRADTLFGPILYVLLIRQETVDSCYVERMVKRAMRRWNSPDDA